MVLIDVPAGVRVTYFDTNTNARISSQRVPGGRGGAAASRPTSASLMMPRKTFGPGVVTNTLGAREPLTHQLVNNRSYFQAHVQANHERWLMQPWTMSMPRAHDPRPHTAARHPSHPYSSADAMHSLASLQSAPAHRPSGYATPSLASLPNQRWEDAIADSKRELQVRLEPDEATNARYPVYNHPPGHPLGPPLHRGTPSAAELHQRRCAIMAAERTKEIMERQGLRPRRSQAALLRASSSAAALAPPTPPPAVAPAPAAPTKRVVDRAALKNSQIVRSAVEGLNSRFSNMLKAFKYGDLDGSGTLNKKEIMRALDLWNIPLDHEALDMMIAACDNDGDGEVDYKEFVDVLARDTVAPAAMGKRDLQAKEAMGKDDLDDVTQAVKRRPKDEGSRTVNSMLFD